MLYFPYRLFRHPRSTFTSSQRFTVLLTSQFVVLTILSEQAFYTTFRAGRMFVDFMVIERDLRAESILSRLAGTMVLSGLISVRGKNCHPLISSSWYHLTLKSSDFPPLGFYLIVYTLSRCSQHLTETDTIELSSEQILDRQFRSLICNIIPFQGRLLLMICRWSLP